jgi:hypothetical protein
MRLNRKERAQRRQRVQEAMDAYRASHSAEEMKRHRAAYFPSGRHSHGGANRSSNLRRERAVRIIHVDTCPACGGVTPDVTQLTSLFALCACGTVT